MAERRPPESGGFAPLCRRTPRRYRGSLAGLGVAALIARIAANFTKLL